MASVLKKGGLPSRTAAVWAALALMALCIAAPVSSKFAELLAAGVAGYGLAVVVSTIVARWSWLVYGLAGVVLLIPEDDRYTLHGFSAAGFELEPWRILMSIMVVGWIAAVMVDPRVRLEDEIRRTSRSHRIGHRSVPKHSTQHE